MNVNVFFNKKIREIFVECSADITPVSCTTCLV